MLSKDDGHWCAANSYPPVLVAEHPVDFKPPIPERVKDELLYAMGDAEEKVLKYSALEASREFTAIDTSLGKQAKKLNKMTEEKNILFRQLMEKSDEVADEVREATGEDAVKTQVFLVHMPKYKTEFTQAALA